MFGRGLDMKSPLQNRKLFFAIYTPGVLDQLVTTLNGDCQLTACVVVVARTDSKIRKNSHSCRCDCLVVCFFRLLPFCMANYTQGMFGKDSAEMCYTVKYIDARE